MNKDLSKSLYTFQLWSWQQWLWAHIQKEKVHKIKTCWLYHFKVFFNITRHLLPFYSNGRARNPETFFEIELLNRMFNRPIPNQPNSLPICILHFNHIYQCKRKSKHSKYQNQVQKNVLLLQIFLFPLFVNLHNVKILRRV